MNLIGLNGLGGSYGGGGGRNRPTAPRHESFTLRSARGPEVKAAERLIEALNVLSFNVPLFVFTLRHRASHEVTSRIMELVNAFIDLMAERIEDDSWRSDDEFRAGIQAMRYRDAR